MILNVPPQAHILNTWLEPVALLGGGKTLSRWAPVGKYRSLGTLLWVVYWDAGPFLSLHFLATMKLAALFHYKLLTMMLSLTTSPPKTGPTDYGLKSLKSWFKINLSFLELTSSGILSQWWIFFHFLLHLWTFPWLIN